MCKKCEHSCGSSKSSKSDKGKIGVKGWLAIGGVGFVAVSAIGQSGKESSASATTVAAKVNFGPLSSDYNDLFIKEGKENGISPILLASVAKAESSFNPNARSKAGAQGLMQIMPSTAKELGVNPLDPEQAVDGAARMLSRDIKQFGSDEDGIAAYNAGPGAVAKAHGVPHIVETQNYVAKVEANVRSAK